MPLPIAHGFFAASLTTAVHRKPFENYHAPLFLSGFLSVAPDFDFLLVFLFQTGRWHRGFTHSILFAVLIWALLRLYFGAQRRREALAYGLAFASHFFLDFVTTKKGGGLELFFPFSTERYGLRWFGFSEMPGKASYGEIAQFLGMEFLIFGAIFLAVYYFKRRALNNRISL